MAEKTQRVRTITIANGASDSDPIDLSGVEDIILVSPAAWTAAAITFRISPDGGTTYYPVYDEAGNELTVSSANWGTARAITLTTLALQAMISSANLLVIRSGTTASPVNQGAARTILAVLGG